jgi:adenylate cyclase
MHHASRDRPLDRDDLAPRILEHLYAFIAARHELWLGVAGVVGKREFFYDGCGDAVNVAARMETTGAEGSSHSAVVGSIQ